MGVFSEWTENGRRKGAKHDEQLSAELVEAEVQPLVWGAERLRLRMHGALSQWGL